MSVLLSLLACSAALSFSEPADSLLDRFRTPERAARPYVWWHWMDGEVSPEGIRKDLEWMDAAGIGGFHQFDAGGVNMPKAAPVKRPYLSPAWKDTFREAVRIADSLGLEMTVASAPGWSSTGGPWVSPEDAMKKLEWTSVDVPGGKVRTVLPPLEKVVGPYKDIPRGSAHVDVAPYGYDVALVAVSLARDDKPMAALDGTVTAGEDEITVTFPRKTLIRSFTLRSSTTGFRPREGRPRMMGHLLSSADGKQWKSVMDIPVSPLEYVTCNIPPTAARSFRIVGKGVRDLVLYPVSRVDRFEEKAGYCFPYDFPKGGTTAAYPREVIDLTGKMAADGTLEADLPPGRWRIYRFGASLTGKMNHPASPNATGLEVDKMNPQAWERYFHAYLDLYKEAAGGRLGERGITHLLVDSYEAGTETWTPALPEEFARRRGYALRPWLPVLAGEIIGSGEESEAFLKDWRKTLGELFTENYGRIQGLVSAYGMKGTYIEAHETGRAFVGDGMDAKKGATVPMAAIWTTDSPSGSTLASALSDIRESASVAHIYGQNLVAAESFTANGDGKKAYTYHPASLKAVADAALSAGLNRFVIHDSASQPSDDYLPGLGLFRYGQWFHRNETWAGYARVWTDYLARSCQLLQEGRAVADILLFYGEDTNATSEYGGEYLKFLPRIPAGYNFDYASPDVLLGRVRCNNGCLTTESGQRYRVLALGKGCKELSPALREAIDRFAAGGVCVCSEEDLPAALGRLGLGCDCAFGPTEGRFLYETPAQTRDTRDRSLGGVQFVHRTLPDADIYWLCNFTGEEVEGEVRLRAKRPFAACLNPENGRGETLQTLPCEEGSRVHLALGKGDARFIVLTDREMPLPPAAAPAKPVEIMPLTRWWDVDFHQKGGESARETYSTLTDWTQNSDPVIRYFSGTAEYTTTFTLDAETLAANALRLDLGDVRVMAEVVVNGQEAGVLWRAPFLTDDIKPLLREGENELTVRVTNLWVNRMIGDRQRGEKPVTSVRRFYTAGDRLLPSGLLGPVRLLFF